jgi:RNA polymerase primary sigma factor
MGKTVTRKPRRQKTGKANTGLVRNASRRSGEARRTRTAASPERAPAHTPDEEAHDEEEIHVEAAEAAEPAGPTGEPTDAAAPDLHESADAHDAPDLHDLAELEEEHPHVAPVRAAKEASKVKTDSEDHLSTYFRDLAVHDLLGPEQEREIAQGIEDQEILTWERVLARAEAVPYICSLLEGKTEQPIHYKKLLKCAEVVCETAKAKQKPQQKKLEQAAREVAEQLRPQDVDRILIDAVIRELRRISSIAARGGADHVPGAAPLPFAVGADFDAYLASIQDAYAGSSQLREEFVRANLRLVVTMARRYDRGGMPLSDLIQEGNLGLMHAVSRFDYRRGLRFSTYACWWIRHAIGRALADKARAVRIPVHMLEAQQQLEKVRQQLIGELGRQPTPQELAKAARVPLAKLNQMHRYLMGQPMSLDRPVHEDDDRAFGEMLADPHTEELSPADAMTTEALTKQVSKLLRDLSPIEADVLRQRFGLVDDEERTFREIGDQYRLSRERIRQIQNSALDKLKKALVREHPGLLDV